GARDWGRQVVLADGRTSRERQRARDALLELANVEGPLVHAEQTARVALEGNACVGKSFAGGELSRQRRHEHAQVFTSFAQVGQTGDETFEPRAQIGAKLPRRDQRVERLLAGSDDPAGARTRASGAEAAGRR